MSGYQTPAGWYPDSTSNGALRWWDGAQWTDQFHVPDDRPAGPAAPSAFGQAYRAQPQTDPSARLWNQPVYGSSPQARRMPKGSFADRNKCSLITLVLCAFYLVLNTQLHVILFGFIPLSMSVRALGRKEQLGVAALIVAIGVLAFGIMTLTHGTTT